MYHFVDVGRLGVLVVGLKQNQTGSYQHRRQVTCTLDRPCDHNIKLRVISSQFYKKERKLYKLMNKNSEKSILKKHIVVRRKKEGNRVTHAKKQETNYMKAYHFHTINAAE